MFNSYSCLELKKKKKAAVTMAANDFYNSPYHGNYPPRYDQVSPAPDPFRRQASPASHVSPYAPSEPDLLQHPQHSQPSLVSDHSAYPTAARVNENDYYSENIPLKSHAPYANGPQEGWMRQPTHYPPSPEVVEPPVDGRGRRKKKGFFKKKLAWVTYTLTLVQIVVFIVELVKNGMYYNVLLVDAD